MPGVEVPYIGSVLGIPLRAASEYHSSTFVISAIVVPTAADLAFGLTFTHDRLVNVNHSGKCSWPGEGTRSDQNYCTLRKAESLTDLGNAPIRAFNRFKVKCLATGGRTPYPTLDIWESGEVSSKEHPQAGSMSPDNSACKQLDLRNVLRDADPVE